MMTEVLGVKTAKDAIDVLGKLGMIDKLLLKLQSRPDLAHPKLRVVLLEIRKTCEALANSINEIDQLSFAKRDLPDTQRQIQKMLQGPLKIDLELAKGSCARIGHIYRTYLRGWISKVVDAKQAAEFNQLFLDASNMDGHVMKLAEELHFEVLELARHIDKALKTSNVAYAKKITAAFTKRYEPYLPQINDWLAFMFSLDTKLIQLGRLT